MLVYSKYTVWFLLTSGVYGQIGTQESQVAIAMMCMSQELTAWYKAFHADKPTEALTRIQALNAHLLGVPSKPKMRSNGGGDVGVHPVAGAHAPREGSAVEARSGEIGGRGRMHYQAGTVVGQKWC